jgi:hypothetical protein
MWKHDAISDTGIGRFEQSADSLVSWRKPSLVALWYGHGRGCFETRGGSFADQVEL